MREDKIVDRIDFWLEGLFSPSRRNRTVQALHEAGQDPRLVEERQSLTKKLKVCEEKLGRYREALEAGADSSTVAAWMADIVANAPGSGSLWSEQCRRAYAMHLRHLHQPQAALQLPGQSVHAALPVRLLASTHARDCRSAQ